MIQANELRIGNWVKDKSNANFQISIQMILNVSNGYEILFPIEITEEWLVKFNFDSFSECGRKTGTFGHLKINGIYFDLNNKKLIFIDKGWSQSVCFEKSIEYAHELQNIIFALTGQELTIKN